MTPSNPGHNGRQKDLDGERDSRMVASYEKEKQGIAPEAINAPQEARPYHYRPQSVRSSYQIYNPATGRGWWLKPGENTVGRGFDNDIVVTDISISRHHASIYVEGTSVHVQDLGSTNGTFVGGERVKTSVLQLDCLFRLGKLELALTKPTFQEPDQGAWTRTWD